MIHYHGTPIGGSGPDGGSGQDAARFLKGRHALVSFRNPAHLGIALYTCQSVVLDNGAYSFWKAGKGEVDVEKYHRWVSGLAGHPSLDWCLIPDKIDGTEKENIDLVALWLRMGCKVEGVPIWHLHESLDWLEYLVDNFRTVALGSSGEYSRPGSWIWWDRMGQAMDRATDAEGKARCRLHGLRMLDPAVFTHLPLSSADSTNVAINTSSLSRFGTYRPPSAHQRSAVIADRIEQYSSSPVWEGIPNKCIIKN